MKYVTITFDDGRKDNYLNAFPVMNSRGLVATLFCATGYIDGTWSSPVGWKSAGGPLNVSELRSLCDAGWEIAIHGDTHITDIEDSRTAIQKLRNWGFDGSSFGFSVPNSTISQNQLEKFMQELVPKEIRYVRAGRNRDMKKFSSKVLFGLYSLGFQTAYDIFNSPSVSFVDWICSTEPIHSIVVRNTDKPQMILDFIEGLPDGAWVVLMLHSILSSRDAGYGADAWYWELSDFEVLCEGLDGLRSQGAVSIATMKHIIKESNVCL